MRLLPFFVMLFLLGLSACAEPASRVYSYTPPPTPGGRLCTTQCGEARDYCNQSCDLHQRQCTNNAQTQAIHDYDQYTRDQFMSHRPIEFRVSDFERSGPCNDARKDCRNECEDHYKACYENCGGKVQITTSCQFLCF